MKRWMWRASVLLLAVVIAAAATACSKNSPHRWAKSTGDTFRLHVSIPVWNPHFPGGDNQEEWFVNAVAVAVAEMNSHPDLQVNYSLSNPQGINGGGPGSICDDNFNNFKPNCVEAWLVPNAELQAHQPETPGVVGLAFRFANPTYYFNGNPDANPAVPARIEVANDWTGQPNGLRQLAVLHELGHMLGLEHADRVDTDGDGNPDYQPVGPGVTTADPDDPIYDRDTESPFDQAGYDWQNLDIKYNACVNDTDFPHPGGGPVDPVNDDLTSGGYDACGAGAASRSASSSGSPPEALSVVVDTAEDVSSG
jgi:hypothetical protein